MTREHPKFRAAAVQASPVFLDLDATIDKCVRLIEEAARNGASLIAFPETCLIPRFDGAILSQGWKEALWDKFVTGAPRPRTPSEQQYSDRKLRSRS